MASDDYTAVGGGGLRLKGAKVQKKKKKRDKTDLEKNLASGEKDVVKKSKAPKEEEKADKNDDKNKEDEKSDDDDRPQVQKTESERRYEEIKRKRVSLLRPTESADEPIANISTSSFKWPKPQARDPNCSRHTKSESKNSTPTSPGSANITTCPGLDLVKKQRHYGWGRMRVGNGMLEFRAFLAIPLVHHTNT